MKHPSGAAIYYREPETMLLRIANAGEWVYKQTHGGGWVYVWVRFAKQIEQQKSPASGGAEE